MADLSRKVAAALWGAVLVVAWFLYAPAFSAVFMLDDFPNLAGLAAVNDFSSAMSFVLSGESGFLGRPLALATFLPQADAWPRSATPFLQVNVVIHLLNASLLWFIAYRLLETRCEERGRRSLIAMIAAALWLLMPLLASASLMVIQRMTTLAAFFVLLGLAFYLFFRADIERRPSRAFVGMSMALVAGTVFGVLAKENAALLPTFALVAEVTLLVPPRSVRPRLWRAWSAVFLVAPTILIVAVLLWHVPYSEEIIARRQFTAWERVLTESRILWGYLFDAFLPRPGQFSPFHDDVPVVSRLLEFPTLAAVVAWIAAIAGATLWRRRYPLFAFAVLWFIAGHLLESTILPLDLYFEHRNYLPVVGPLFAVCALLTYVPARRRAHAYAGVAAYGAVCALMLFNVTSLWGNPSLAFAYWQKRSPESTYAATAAMAHVQATQGPEATMRMIDDFVHRVPEAGYLGIHRLRLACIVEPAADRMASVRELRTLLGSVEFSFSAVTMLSQLAEQVSRSSCRGVDLETVRELANALAENPRYEPNRRYNQLHHQFLAQTFQYEGERAAVIRHLQKAAQFGFSSGLNQMMVLALIDANRSAEAREFIADARGQAPRNPFKRIVWQRKLDELVQYVDRHAVRDDIGDLP